MAFRNAKARNATEGVPYSVAIEIGVDYDDGMSKFDKWISMATPESLTETVARAAVGLRLDAVTHFLPLAAFLAHEDMEYIHAARVSTRRATAALRLFSEFVPSKRRKRMKRMLGEIRASMAGARDLDVYLQRFGKLEDEGAASFRQRLERKRSDAQKSIIKCAVPLLKKQEFRVRAAILVDKMSSDQSAESNFYGDWAARQLAVQWQSFVDAAPDVNPIAEDLHEFRIAGKRFRYAIELLSGGLPRVVRDQVYPEVEQLQDQLGEIQDHAVAAEKLLHWQRKSKTSVEREMLVQFEHDERKQFRGKCAAFNHWWRADRVDGLREVMEQISSITA